MTKFEINGKEYEMVVNLGTLTMAEMLNKGVDESQKNRLNIGFGLACFYGADMNCGLTIEDIAHSINTTAKYNEFLKAIKHESDLFNGINEDMPTDEEPAEDVKKN